MAKKKPFSHFNTMKVDIIHKCSAYATNKILKKIIRASCVVTNMLHLQGYPLRIVVFSLLSLHFSILSKNIPHSLSLCCMQN